MESSPLPPQAQPDFLPAEWHLPRAAPLEIDVGCHKGLFLVEMAKRHPERNFLGIEKQSERVERTQKKIRAMNLPNALVVRSEGLAALKSLPPNCATFVHVLFPDPWPKRRHHDRRLVQTQFLDECLRVLKRGGLLRLVTDDASYAATMTESAAKNRAFTPASDLREYPQTEFQKKFLPDARSIHSLLLTKKTNA